MDQTTILLIAGGVVGLLVLLGLLIWWTRSEESLTSPVAPAPKPKPETRFTEEGGIPAPRFEDLLPGELTKGSFSAQLQTDKFNLRIEQVKGQTRYVVNGVSYNSLEEIPGGEIRRIAQKLYAKVFQGRGEHLQENEVVRQVVMGNQRTIEAKSKEAVISVQRRGRRTRFIVNGMTFYKLNEIPDPDLRRRARDLISKMI
jgi:hypothetical protein